MIQAHALEVVAEAYADVIPAVDKVRWLKRRIKDGRIPGKRLSRNVVVMTDKHIEEWLNGDDAPEPAPVEPVSIVDGLAAHRRAS
ncbi:hypothetical protein BA059_16680 [Mycolicibacterium sp. (ex Dasyatis americana)]|nr:hypothetical protein BA059_16680 [Mycolicibacterium sp. (ex Dasyatis americana)]